MNRMGKEYTMKVFRSTGSDSRAEALRRPFLYGCRLLLACFLLLAGCRPEMPSGVISPSRMEALLYDYHVAQAMAEESYDSIEELRYVYVQAVFRKHGITEADFDSSMVWYSAHADYLSGIYRRLSARYEAESKAYGTGTSESELYANLSSQGDTANIWTDRVFYVLKPNRIENKIAFSMKADSTFRRGDSFLWRFTPRFVCKEGSRTGFAAMLVRYADGKVTAAHRRIEGDWNVKMELKADAKRDIRELYGFVYFPSTDVKVYRMMVVSDVSLIRFHSKRETPVEKDMLTVIGDTLTTDTLQRKTAEEALSEGDTANARRLTPTELRRTQDGERTIEVVKERPYTIPKNTRRQQRQTRR